ncbi:MAG: histidine kinase dimerization/phospho-acceptor domain-containing protein [Flavobacteriaceae bacterium]|nr:histidine kinase dimerization/phospho-acceptor domain-containing protein [Flavobacteriaceae bacterium]
MNSKDQQITSHQEVLHLSKETINSIKKDKSQFLGQLVHNLKNPVGSALSFSDMILEDVDNYSPEKLKRHLNIIKSSCEAALNQLDILLIESKIEIKELDLFLQETLFSDLIKNCLSDNKNNFIKNNFTIEVSFLEGEMKINLDRKFIKHTLHGLIQFFLLHSGNNTNLKVNLKTENELLILNIESNQCAKCDEKIEEYITGKLFENDAVFNLKQEKFLNFQDISFIAQKHHGYFTLSKNDSHSLVLTFAISTEF